MKIKLADILPEKGLTLTFRGSEDFMKEILARLTAEDVDATTPLPVAPSIEAKLHVTRDGRTVMIDGQAKASYQAACARCLKPVPTSLAPRIQVALFPEKADDVPAGEVEMDAHDLDEFTYVGDVVDIGDVLNEHLLLARPYRALCSEKCRGLCPTCGRDLNESPCSCSPPTRPTALSALASMGSKN